MLATDSTIVAIAFDTDRRADTGVERLPRDPGALFPGTDEVITTWGSGAEGSAAAAGLSALVYVPVGIATFAHHPPTATALREAAAAGILSSAVPVLADMLALRRVPTRLFGVFMSVNPVLAALVGLVVLDQALGWPEWLAIAAIVTANTVSVLATGRRATGGSSGPPG